MQQRGLTFVELLIGLLISSLITIGLYTLVGSQAKQSRAQIRKSQQLRTAIKTKDTIRKDLMDAGYGRFDLKLESVATAERERIVLQSDFDESGVIETADPPPTGKQVERIEYRWDAAQQKLERNGDLLLGNVAGLTFDYYFEDSWYFERDWGEGSLPPTPPPLTAQECKLFERVRVNFTVLDPGTEVQRTELVEVILPNSLVVN